MKKHGFTLAELLISLVIIGLGAALLTPTLVNTLPDRYKTRVLRNYNLISKVNQDLLSNSDIYYRKNIDSSISASDYNANGTLKSTTQYGCNGLFCTEMPLATSGYYSSPYTGICKYPNLLANVLQMDNIIFCTAGSTIAKGIMPDKSYWEISAVGNSVSNGYNISIDMDTSTNSSNCSYDKTNCKHPDTFKFFINSDGDVSAADNLTSVYLSKMTNMAKSNDFEEAASKTNSTNITGNTSYNSTSSKDSREGVIK